MSTHRGIAASPGLAAGHAWVVRLAQSLSPALPRVPADENARLDLALAMAGLDLEARRDELARSGVGDEWLALLDAHRAMLDDPLLTRRAHELTAIGWDAALAVERAAADVAALFLERANDELSARLGDLNQVRDRVLWLLLSPEEGRQERLEPPPQAVLVARDLTPEDLLELCGGALAPGRTPLRAICLDTGSRLSHTAILARHLGIPTVCGLADLSSRLDGGEGLMVDGDEGTVKVRPAGADVDRWAASERARRAPLPGPLPAVGARPLLWHGERVWIHANLDLPEQAGEALVCGAEGIGLLRTDRMRAKGEPDEDEQAERFMRLVEAMGGRPVTIRLFDRPAPGPNPALGVRGVRWMRHRPDDVRAQLRAACRAAAEGPVRVLAPMVSRASEVALLREWLDEAWGRAGGAGQRPQVGAMIETPAAAILADEVLEACDFVAVGTNDLTQFTLAADREDERTSPLLDPAHPAVRHLLRNVARAAEEQGKPAMVCGELASDPGQVGFLLSIGFRHLSLSPSRIPAIRQIVSTRHLDSAD